MLALPTGTRVPTGRFLYIDPDGSTRLWERRQSRRGKR